MELTRGIMSSPVVLLPSRAEDCHCLYIFWTTIQPPKPFTLTSQHDCNNHLPRLSAYLSCSKVSIYFIRASKPLWRTAAPCGGTYVFAQKVMTKSSVRSAPNILGLNRYHCCFEQIHKVKQQQKLTSKADTHPRQVPLHCNHLCTCYMLS